MIGYHGNRPHLIYTSLVVTLVMVLMMKGVKRERMTLVTFGLSGVWSSVPTTVEGGREGEGRGKR